MQRNILILVVFFSFLGVVLAQKKNLKVLVITDGEPEEHPGSVYFVLNPFVFKNIDLKKAKFKPLNSLKEFNSQYISCPIIFNSKATQ
jgi:prephenate dehydratase